MALGGSAATLFSQASLSVHPLPCPTLCPLARLGVYAGALVIAVFLSPPPRSPSLFLVKLGNPNKILSKFKVLLVVFCPAGEPSPGTSLFYRPSNHYLLYALVCQTVVCVAGLGGRYWFSAGELCRPQRCVRAMRTILANGRARLRKPLPHQRLQWSSAGSKQLPTPSPPAQVQRKVLRPKISICSMIHLFIYCASNLSSGIV